MKHQTINQLHDIADVHFEPALRMTRAQRLERWAELLEQEPDRLLSALSGTEYQPTVRRGAMRADGSPLSIAYEDPVLRAEGLEDDTYGEAKRFFEVADWQLHQIVCYCHVGASMTTSRAAHCVRAAISQRFNILARLRAMLV